MSLMDGLDFQMDTLQHDYMFDLGPLEQTVVDDIMGEVSISMMMQEDEITLEQNDGLLEFGVNSGVPLLDLAGDVNYFPCKLGIEATDMGSLLEQFEEASQTLTHCDYLEPTFTIDKTLTIDRTLNIDQTLTIDRTLTIDSVIDSIPSVEIEVDSIPHVEIKVDSIPQAALKVDSIPCVEIKVDRIPRVELKVTSIPRVELKVDSIPRLHTKVDSIPLVHTKVDSIPRVHTQVDIIPQAALKVDSIPCVEVDSIPCVEIKVEKNTDTNDNVEKKCEPKLTAEMIQKKCEPKLTNEMIQRIRSLRQKKTSSAIMVPMAVPAKRGRGRAMTRGHSVALPSGCTPLRLQRVMQQNQILRDCLPVNQVDPEIKIKIEPVDEQIESKVKKKENVEVKTKNVDENYFELIHDHDYPKNVSNPKIDPTVSEAYRNDMEDGEIIEEEENVNIKYKTSLNAQHNRIGENLEFDDDGKQYFNKLPSYCTALSIPRKTIKRTASSVTSRGGISVHDYIQRDTSPVHDKPMYSKLPDYYSSFTNSTKYDSLEANKPPSVDESKDSGYSSLNHSPQHSHSRSHSRSLSRSRSRSNSPTSYHLMDRQGCQSSYSPFSRYSSSRSCSMSSCSCSCSSRSSSCSSTRSRSCSTCSSSRSRSRSAERSWKRERSLRGERSHRKSRSRTTSKSYYDKSRSQRKHSSRRGRSIRRHSRSRSRSLPRSLSRSQEYSSVRSRSRSPVRRSRSPVRRRTESQERRRIEMLEEKNEEKKQQMKDRRIVYVGGVPEGFTRREMRQRFGRFGEIENVQLHFREHGDNYGFVTFVYTCDAFAAIEKGKQLPGLEKFDLCFGGRRQFCDREYADLDGNKEIEEEFDPKPQNSGTLDFDELLRQARLRNKKS